MLNQDKDVYVYLRKHIIIDKKQTKSSFKQKQTFESYNLHV